MTQPIRLPLIEAIEPRAADSSKDGLSSNIYFDQNKNGASFAVKRPGLTLHTAGLGQATGLFGGFTFGMPTGYFEGVVWNGNKFCAIHRETQSDFAPSNISITSTDGITWYIGTLPQNATWQDVCWNGTVFCAVGSSGTSPVCATSTDGLTWTSRTVPTGRLLAVAANSSGRLVATGIKDSASYNTAYSTDNGASWTGVLLSAADYSVYDIAYNSTANLFAAVGLNSSLVAALHTTADGITWTSRTVTANQFRPVITSSNTTFVTARDNAISTDTTKVETSTDGITWTERTLPAKPSGATTGSWDHGTWTGSKFVITSETADVTSTSFYCITSADGTTWSNVTISSEADGTVGTPIKAASVAGNANTTIILSATTGEYGSDLFWKSDDNAVTFSKKHLEVGYHYPLGTY